MGRVTAEIGVDYGHTVTMHESKCKHLHGHRGRVIATVDGEIISDPNSSSNGMVIDFGDLKKAMMRVIDAPYDHAFMVWKEDPRAKLLSQAHDMWHNDINKFHLTDFIPTAENITKHWFNLLEVELRTKYNILLQSIEMYETPSSSAIYTRDDFLRDNK